MPEKSLGRWGEKAFLRLVACSEPPGPLTSLSYSSTTVMKKPAKKLPLNSGGSLSGGEGFKKTNLSHFRGFD